MDGTRGNYGKQNNSKGETSSDTIRRSGDNPDNEKGEIKRPVISLTRGIEKQSKGSDKTIFRDLTAKLRRPEEEGGRSEGKEDYGCLYGFAAVTYN